MKGKAIARQGFCDVYQEDNRNGFSRPHVSIDWRKQPASGSVLRARITRLLRQETAQVEDSHPRWFVQPSANCRNLGVASAIAESSFQLLTIGALIAI
jgi:hypothetical protein